jgi:hypothetical protein
LAIGRKEIPPLFSRRKFSGISKCSDFSNFSTKERGRQARGRGDRDRSRMGVGIKRGSRGEVF